MPTECSPALFEFAPVENRRVVAGFDGGAITSNAGALLLGATDRAIRLVGRFAALGAEAIGSTREELAARVASEDERWGELVRAAGITAE